jgi:hypothetical protein
VEGGVLALRPPLSIVLVVLVIAGTFHFVTIRAGHDWGDDFSMYILHARNLVEGRAYLDTGYIFNPRNPIGPTGYPPVFPALLAPVYALWGLDLVAMRGLIVLCFLAALVVLCVLVRPFLPWSYVLALTAILAFNPFFWRFKDHVLSDIPFLFFALLALLLIERAPRLTTGVGKQIGLAVLTGAVLYLAYGTRTVGIVLVPVLVLHDLLRHRRPALATFLAVGVFVLAAGAQRLLMASGTNYLQMYTFNAAELLRQGEVYLWGPGVLWQGASADRPRRIFIVMVSLLALLGYLLRCAQRPRACELFVPLYLLPVLLVRGFQDGRYLIPILPLYLAYALYAVSRGATMLPRPARALALGLFLAPIAFGYGWYYMRADFGPIPDGVEKAETVAFFRYVRDHTEPGAVFVCRKPRALALYGGRPASVYHRQGDAHDLWRYFRDIRASYLVLSPPDRPFWRDFVQAQTPQLRRVYANPDFELFRILDYPP